MTCTEIIERIRCEMNRKHITYYSLARKTHLNPSTIRRWLHGEAAPTLLSLSLICSNLGLTLDVKGDVDFETKI